MKSYCSYGNRLKPVELSGGVDFMCGCIYGLVRSHTVSHSLSRSYTIANTIIHGHGTCVRFLKVLKIIHDFHGYTRMAQVQLG